ncbi:EscU/YscU/HrcU family type III secretion system export apparatus switch protein [Timonella sp. A28]|uniref:EscU/YscU/HrcU family type III secretion system export apparatus switch protein n=1 Tax=Timonella sp. A28 TaxID=3442640 RepID=UPI003EBABAE4
MSSEPAEERTEKATPKRMKEVRKEGSLQKSQDLGAWAGIGICVALIPFTFSRATDALHEQIAGITHVVKNPEPESALELFNTAMRAPIIVLLPLLIAVFIVAILANVAVGGLTFSTARLKPKFKQFNLLKGLKNMFSMMALWNGAKALLKTIVIGVVLYTVVQHMTPLLLGAGGLSLGNLIEAAKYGINRMLWTAIAAGIVLAAIDILVVMKRNRKKTRMTKKEVRDENKNTEGDPLLKGHIRSRQLAMSRNRMISNVSDADVVLVNPTHVAVALKYVPGEGAPRLVAKGSGLIAHKIKEQAIQHSVPIVQDIPLARALHGACDIGHEVPEALFTAVAQVLAFVMTLKRHGSAMTSVHTMATATDVPDDMYTVDDDTDPDTTTAPSRDTTP